MAFTYRDGIAVLQLIAFVPCFLLSIWLCFKQGMKAVASCWRFLIALASLRIAGAICELLLMTDHDESVTVAKIVCDLMGIAPLTLACVGLLQRVNESANKITWHVFTLITIVSILGLVLGIVGAVKAVDGTTFKISSTMKAALAMFIISLVLMICILVCLTTDAHHRVPASERRILFSVYVCSPFLIVRVLYAVIGDYGSDPRFNLFDGNPTIFLCMSVLEEISVMIICLVVGFMTPPPLDRKNDAASFHALEANYVNHENAPLALPLHAPRA